jgi:hypothetical protein
MGRQYAVPCRLLIELSVLTADVAVDPDTAPNAFTVGEKKSVLSAA